MKSPMNKLMKLIEDFKQLWLCIILRNSGVKYVSNKILR